MDSNNEDIFDDFGESDTKLCTPPDIVDGADNVSA